MRAWACGLSPSSAGLLRAALGVGAMFAFPVVGRLTGRFGVRTSVITGASASLGGTVLLAMLVQHGLVVELLVVALFLRA